MTTPEPPVDPGTVTQSPLRSDCEAAALAAMPNPTLSWEPYHIHEIGHEGVLTSHNTVATCRYVFNGELVMLRVGIYHRETDDGEWEHAYYLHSVHPEGGYHVSVGTHNPDFTDYGVTWASVRDAYITAMQPYWDSARAVYAKVLWSLGQIDAEGGF